SSGRKMNYNNQRGCNASQKSHEPPELVPMNGFFCKPVTHFPARSFPVSHQQHMFCIGAHYFFCRHWLQKSRIQNGGFEVDIPYIILFQDAQTLPWRLPEIIEAVTQGIRKIVILAKRFII